MKKSMGKSISFKFILLSLPVIAVVFLFIIFSRPAAQREDYKKIASEAYDTVFLSMYPIDTYSEADFQNYYDLTAFKASYCIPSFSVMEQYMKRIARSGNTILSVYLGIRPDKVSLQELEDLINQYPSVIFEIILAYPSSDYWTSLSEEEYQQVLSDYSAFLLGAPEISNSHFFFPGHCEWLLANPDNYENPWLVNESIARTILLESTIFNEHFVVPGKVSLFTEDLAAVTGKMRTAPESFPDLSGKRLVFFGDSVIGNYTDSASIPGVVAGLSGASVYNCGYGGNTAAECPDALIALPGIAKAFAERNLSALPQETQVYRGVSSYLSENSPDSPDENLCFVINYGLNDYFLGLTVSSEENPMDTATYRGAIRTAVDTLLTSFPNAQIILCTPSYCHYYQDGTEPHGDGKYVLKDYVDSVLSLSEELQVDVLDTYHDLGVDSGNWNQYLPDQVHPDAAYRYLIGKSLIRLIR